MLQKTWISENALKLFLLLDGDKIDYVLDHLKSTHGAKRGIHNTKLHSTRDTHIFPLEFSPLYNGVPNGAFPFLCKNFGSLHAPETKTI
eukprot:UN02657